METKASSRDRHEAFVKGQENLTGVKEVTHKYTLKKEKDGSIIVSHSKRTDMIFDTEQEAKDAFLDIHDAKDEADFEESGTEMEEREQKEEAQKEKEEHAEASYKVGMTVKAKYEVKANDLLNNKIYITDGKTAGWVSTSLLKIAEDNKNFDLDVEKNMIVPADTGTGNPSSEKTPYPINMDSPVTSNEVEQYAGPSGYAIMQPPSPGAASMVGKAGEQDKSLLQNNFSISLEEKQLQLGVNRELEHTNDPAKALEIAIDHLAEDPQYYTKLNKVMPEYGPEEKPERTVSVTKYPDDITDAVNTFNFDSAYKEFTPTFFEEKE